jgi:hypothetical protein
MGRVALVVVIAGIVILGAVFALRALRGRDASEGPPIGPGVQIHEAGTEPDRPHLPETRFVDPELIPAGAEEIVWYRSSSACLGQEDHPELFRRLHRLMGEVSERHARPGDPGPSLSRVFEMPWFAVGLRDGRVVVGDELRLFAADKRSWPLKLREVQQSYSWDARWRLTTSPALRVSLPSWRVTRLYRSDLPLSAQRWVDARGPYAEEARALAEELLPYCPRVVGGEPGELGAAVERSSLRGRSGLPCIIRFSQPITVTVFRPEWDPVYYYKEDAPDYQCTVTRAENVRCDQVALYGVSPSDYRPPSARVYYHAVGEEGWWYVGIVAVLRASAGSAPAQR